MKKLVFFLLCLTVTNLPAAEIKVAAASDLKFALDELVAEFQAKHSEIKVSVTYGSSGNFFAQLQNQAPFDLYFSADIAYPKKLVAAGLALENHVFSYAVGRLVVWVPNQSSIEVKKMGMKSLLEPAVKKVAIANPKHAPYGVAARAAMQSLKVYDAVKMKLVYGENIAQTAQFIQSGAADIGVIALSLAIVPQMSDKGRYWEVPLEAYPKMEQGGIILNWTTDVNASRTFRDFVLGDHGREVLKRYGFFLSKK
ncbi:MAG: molybdate ABC transporter substrate-binding protein [Verrucomicrobiae bacterium]|nr:molybdate ABC transporter substrate-binding protein [Verrucomicrobiae bacterium]